MLELYIRGRKLDLDENIDISFTYKTSDLENPTAVKNNFTKTISIKGTPNNNDIFSNCWRLDTNHIMGDSFDPHKREEFIIYDNGDIFERGYIQLNKITRKLNDVTYDVSLYGMLGDFFYNLMYLKDSEEERSLNSLYFNWDEPEREKNNVLFYWNTDFVRKSWMALNNLDSDLTQRHRVWYDITMIPTYRGLNGNDFDNQHCAVNVKNIKATADQWGTTSAAMFPESWTEDGKTYELVDEQWAMVDMMRELSEWEARDLRCSQQYPAIRTKSLMTAITNPENNGGYNVVFDNDILTSPWYEQSYVMLNKIDAEIIKDHFSNKAPDSVDGDMMEDGGYIYISSDPDINYTGGIDCADMENARLSLKIRQKIKTPLSYKDHPIQSYLKTTQKVSGIKTNKIDDLFYGTVMRVEVVDQSEHLLAKTDDMLIFNSSGENPSGIGAVSFGEFNWGGSSGYLNIDNICKAVIANYLNEDYGAAEEHTYSFDNMKEYDLVFDTSKEEYEDGKCVYYTNKYINVTLKLPAQDNMHIHVITHPIWYWVTREEKRGTIVPNTIMKNYGTFSQGTHSNKYIYSVDSSTQIRNYTMGISLDDGSGYGMLSNTDYEYAYPIGKDVLFNGTSTPFKYFIDFCKIFGCKFLVDKNTKTINILTRKNYYKNEVVNLDDKIDYNKDIIIDPSPYEERWYRYGLENIETYAVEIYEKKGDSNYGIQSVSAKNEFSNESKDILKDNIFMNATDWQLNNKMLNTVFITPDNYEVPSALYAGIYNYSLYNSNEKSEKEITAFNPVIAACEFKNVNDVIPKICLFDSENAEVEIDKDNTVFLFYNGKCDYEDSRTMNKYSVRLTNDFIWADLMNNGNQCYVYDPVYSDDYVTISELPVFTSVCLKKYVTGGTWEYDDGIGPYLSTNFNEGKYNLVDYTQMWEDGLYEVGERCSIFYQYWKKYCDDIYSENNRTVELYCFLDNAEANDVLRRFYYFDNSIWIIQEINSYNPKKKELVKCTFMKVNNYVNNYLNDNVVDYLKFNSDHNVDDVISRQGKTILLTIKCPEHLEYTVRNRTGANPADWYLEPNDGEGYEQWATLTGPATIKLIVEPNTTPRIMKSIYIRLAAKDGRNIDMTFRQQPGGIMAELNDE